MKTALITFFHYLSLQTSANRFGSKQRGTCSVCISANFRGPFVISVNIGGQAFDYMCTAALIEMNVIVHKRTPVLRNFTAGFVHVWAIVRYVQNLHTSVIVIGEFIFNIQVQISPNESVTMEDDSTPFFFFCRQCRCDGRAGRRRTSSTARSSATSPSSCPAHPFPPFSGTN